MPIKLEVLAATPKLKTFALQITPSSGHFGDTFADLVSQSKYLNANLTGIASSSPGNPILYPVHFRGISVMDILRWGKGQNSRLFLQLFKVRRVLVGDPLLHCDRSPGFPELGISADYSILLDPSAN